MSVVMVSSSTFKVSIITVRADFPCVSAGHPLVCSERLSCCFCITQKSVYNKMANSDVDRGAIPFHVVAEIDMQSKAIHHIHY